MKPEITYKVPKLLFDILSMPFISITIILVLPIALVAWVLIKLGVLFTWLGTSWRKIGSHIAWPAEYLTHWNVKQKKVLWTPWNVITYYDGFQNRLNEDGTAYVEKPDWGDE